MDQVIALDDIMISCYHLDQHPTAEDHDYGEDDAALLEAVGHGQDRHSDDGVGEGDHRQPGHCKCSVVQIMIQVDQPGSVSTMMMVYIWKQFVQDYLMQDTKFNKYKIPQETDIFTQS